MAENVLPTVLNLRLDFKARLADAHNESRKWSLTSYAAFRHDVLDTFRRLRAAQPEFRLLCMYDPTLADPVGWAGDARRGSVSLRHAAAAVGVLASGSKPLPPDRSAGLNVEVRAEVADPVIGEARLTYTLIDGGEPIAGDRIWISK